MLEYHLVQCNSHVGFWFIHAARGREVGAAGIAGRLENGSESEALTDGDFGVEIRVGEQGA